MDYLFIKTAGTSILISGATVWGTFKLFGGKMLDYHFGKSLEKIKKENHFEISKLEAQLDGKLDRATKFHVLEYQIYPDIWDKLVTARAMTESYVRGLYSQLYDPDSPQYEQHDQLDRLKISYDDQIKITSASDKRKEFYEIIEKMKYEEAFKKYTDFQDNLAKNSIFFSPDFRADLLSASKKMYEVLLRTRPQAHLDWEKRDKLLTDFIAECNPIVEKIQEDVRSHLSPLP